MPDILSFLPLVRETIVTIRNRLNADANAGLTPTDPAYLDTTEGNFFWDLTQAPALEIERLWDFLGTEVPAAAFPQYAWGDYLDQHAAMLNMTRKDAVQATGQATFSGTGGTLIPTGTQIAQPAASPDADPIVFVTTSPASLPAGTGTQQMTVNIQASQSGTIGNVAANTVTLLQSNVTGVTTVTNALATTGGSDVESDQALQARILQAWTAPAAAGTISDYERWSLAYEGVGYVNVDPLWNGAGTVRVVVTDANHQPVSSNVLTGLQNELDPTPGLGHGLAPIGAVVTVATVTVLPVNVAATITFLSGYSYDGAGGTVATRTDLTNAINGYISTLLPEQSVILSHVEATLFQVPGVYDVTSLTLNGSAANVNVPALEVASLGTVTLS